ncbi:MAG: hypothetical protein RI101_06690 [Nitrospira sp.]|jgi:hypothetical protein|nr:hypothetical protein [Nitrospira sp.]
MKRKPGEPIYLGGQMLALGLAVICPVALPQLYHMFMSPISFETRVVAGLALAVVSGILLYRLFAAAAKNEP